MLLINVSVKKLTKKVKNINFTPILEYFFSGWHELDIAKHIANFNLITH